jgi:hypothetical protein
VSKAAKKTIVRKEDKRVKLQRFANYAHRTREGMDFVLILVDGSDSNVGCVSSLMRRRQIAQAMRDTFAKLKRERGINEDSATATARAKALAKERFL